jgi:hypothetical protein
MTLNEREFAFLHVPKTGGTFTGQAESDGHTIVSPVRILGHSTVFDVNSDFELDMAKPFPEGNVITRNTISEFNVFSNVRNPFTFFVSYLHHSGGFNPKYRDTNHYDFEAANKSFDYLLKTIANRETLWPSKRFIHYTLFAQPSGDFFPVWLNNVGSLDQDLAELAQSFSLKYIQRDRQRSNGIKDYRAYYTDELVELVMSVWARELEIFGFGFDQLDAWAGREIALKRLQSAKYVWRSDRLSGYDSLLTSS